MSVAPTENGTAAPPGPVASEMMSAGTVSDGGVVSTTRIVNVEEPAFPCASVAVHVTGVSPSGKEDPEEGAQAGERDSSTRAEADEGKDRVAPPGAGAAAAAAAAT